MFAMVCIMLIINTDKVNGKNNLSKREKTHSEVLQESKKEVHLYHNNSKKAVILNQSKMITTLNSAERVFLVKSDRFMGLSDIFCNVKELQKVIDAVEENGNTAKVFHFWDGKLKVCPKKLYKEMIKANA